jgi:hypothetical protein
MAMQQHMEEKKNQHSAAAGKKEGPLLPVEMWHLILGQHPMPLADLLSLSTSSKRLHMIVRCSGMIFLKASSSAAGWPTRHFKSLLGPPYSLRMWPLDVNLPLPKPLEHLSSNIAQMEQQSRYQRLLQCMYGSNDHPPLAPNLYEIPIDSSDDSLQSDSDSDSAIEDEEEEEEINDAAMMTDGEWPPAPHMVYCEEKQMWKLIPRNNINGKLRELMSPSNAEKPKLKRLAIAYTCYISELANFLRVAGMPITLTELELPYSGICAQMLPQTLQRCVLPHSSFKCSLLPFPRSLTYLHVHSLRSAFGSPLNLGTLILNHVSTSFDEIASYLPPAITSLTYPAPIKRKQFKLIPNTIRHLGADLSRIDNGDVIFLPRQVRSLEILKVAGGGSEIDFGEFFKNLPRNLESLVLNNMTLRDADVASLPPNLTFLDFKSNVVGLTHQSFSLLPENLKTRVFSLPKLYKPAMAHHYIETFPQPDWLELEWPKWLSRSLAVTSCGVLPRNMLKLVVDACDWSGPSLKSLPPHLEMLEMSRTVHLEAKDVSRLPRSLKELRVPYAEVRHEFFAPLPRGLQTLVMRGGYSFRTLDLGVELDLPPNLTRLYVSYPFSKHTAVQIPRSVTDLSLERTQMFNEIVLLLPTALTRLSSPDDVSFSDDGIPFLPSSLLILQLEVNSRITNKNLKDLPRGLQALSLPSNNAITDEGVKDLPRTLLQINLQQNTNLTDAAFDDWPPFLACADFTIQSSYKPSAVHDNS